MNNKVLVVTVACAITAPASASRIVYLAEQDVAFVRELYVVDLDRPGESLKLNKPVTGVSEGVGSFAISPDGARIAFSADQTTAGDPDAYIVDITAPDTWVKLGSLPIGHREMIAKFSPDGSKVAFTASDRSFADTQLYVVDLTNPGVATRVNGDLADGGAVSMTGFEFTPDGSHIVYVAGELERKFELYAIDLATPGQSVRLNAAGGNVGDTYEGRFRILPDGRRVVYSAVWQNPGMREVHVVSLDAPGAPSTLNAPFQSNGYLTEFTLSPDGRHVAYTADQETEDVSEIYLVEVNTPGVATKISEPVQGGGGLVGFAPDGKHVFFAADGAREAYERDLYMVPVDLNTNAVQLSAPVNSGEDFGLYGVSADGVQVAYWMTPSGGFPTDLMVARTDAPGSAIKVNGPLPNGSLEYPRPQFSPDGMEVAFLAVESLNQGVQELFFARVSAPGTSIRLNSPLPPDGVVSSTPHAFEFLPADAPPTGNATPGPTPPTTPGPTSSGGGGSMEWLTLFALLTASRKKHGRTATT